MWGIRSWRNGLRWNSMHCLWLTICFWRLWVAGCWFCLLNNSFLFSGGMVFFTVFVPLIAGLRKSLLYIMYTPLRLFQNELSDMVADSCVSWIIWQSTPSWWIRCFCFSRRNHCSFSMSITTVPLLFFASPNWSVIPLLYYPPSFLPYFWHFLELCSNHTQLDSPRSHVLVLLPSSPRHPSLVERMGNKNPNHPIHHRPRLRLLRILHVPFPFPPHPANPL